MFYALLNLPFTTNWNDFRDWRPVLSVPRHSHVPRHERKKVKKTLTFDILIISQHIPWSSVVKFRILNRISSLWRSMVTLDEERLLFFVQDQLLDLPIVFILGYIALLGWSPSHHSTRRLSVAWCNKGFELIASQRCISRFDNQIRIDLE